MELVVLGAGPAYTDRAAPSAPPTSSGIRTATCSWTSGRVVPAAGRRSWSRHDLEAVLVSHLHPDHFIDLVALRHYLRWDLRPPRRVRVLGPAGLADRLDGLHAEPGFSAAALDIEPLGPGRDAIGPFDDRDRPGHATPTRATASACPVGDAPGLVYSGDCGRAEDLDRWCGPATSC